MFETIAALSTIAFVVILVVLLYKDRVSRNEESSQHPSLPTQASHAIMR